MQHNNIKPTPLKSIKIEITRFLILMSRTEFIPGILFYKGQEALFSYTPGSFYSLLRNGMKTYNASMEPMFAMCKCTACKWQ